MGSEPILKIQDNEELSKHHYTEPTKMLEFYCKKQKCLPEHYILLKNFT